MTKILILTQVYPPEIHPTAVMVRELAEHLTVNGWEVTVCAGLPHHPTGRLPNGWRWRPWQRTVERGVKLIRTGHMVHHSRAIPMRGAVLATQALGACAAGLLARHCDAVLVFGPPLVGTNLGALVAGRHRAKLINVIYDLYPDVALETGKVTNSLVIGAARLAERLQYLASDLTIVLSEGFKRQLVDRGVPAERVQVVPVWLDPEEISPGPRDNAWRREQAIPLDRFVVLYAGTIGVVSGAAVVADAAAVLRDRSEVLFLFVGEGEERPRIEARARELRLSNVQFLPFQPRARLSEVQATADVGLVTLAPGRGRTSVPSKVLGYLAAGRPVIASVDEGSDTAKAIQTGNCGDVCVSGSPSSIADTVVQYIDGARDRLRMGSNSRRFFLENYSRDMALAQWLTLMDRVSYKGNDS